MAREATPGNSRADSHLTTATSLSGCGPEISLETPELRKNSLYKVDTLLGALHRFRDALAAEADLYDKGGTR
jgi:hypothetical protein